MMTMIGPNARAGVHRKEEKEHNRVSNIDRKSWNHVESAGSNANHSEEKCIMMRKGMTEPMGYNERTI